ncbi:MAG: RNB domain-containing ribonuclease [Burkholderiales bacterium]|nr:RNB domain-containing ribonuclease [Burkholderiales bacterium]
MSESPASLQVDLPSGRRVKIKSDRVLLRFPLTSPADVMKEAHEVERELDPDFLWEVSPEGEFSFERLALEYFGDGLSIPQKIAIAQKLYTSPIYFYKKGRGVYKKAPVDALNAARAALERKAKEAEQIEQWKSALMKYQMPDAVGQQLSMLLYQPDKNALTYKAYSLACEALKINPVTLADRCGMIPSTHEFHFNRFLAAAFPRGTAFPEFDRETHALLTSCAESLPIADVQAFSIDDRTTTEFDDAFSVSRLEEDRFLLGIHIAAPALAIARDSSLDGIARKRLSTVYMPGRKITMLPDSVIEAFTLKENTTPPALSLYVTINAKGEVLEQKTALNRITMAGNYAFEQIDLSFALDRHDIGELNTMTDKLAVLWRFAQVQNKLRGKKENERTEFSFYVDWSHDPNGVVTIEPRLRGSPLDRLIAECAIFVNNQWGQWLHQHKAAGMYRTKTGARVRMSTKPAEHQGLGVAHYLWATSPLRRYTDMVNQRQLIAVLNNEPPPYPVGDTDLFSIIAEFEATYKQYAEFQNSMERYWCLRWLMQEKIETAEAIVLRRKEGEERTGVRLTNAPLILMLADLPKSLPTGSLIELSINAINPLFATISAHFKSVLKDAGEEPETIDDSSDDDDDHEGEGGIGIENGIESGNGGNQDGNQGGTDSAFQGSEVGDQESFDKKSSFLSDSVRTEF